MRWLMMGIGCVLVGCAGDAGIVASSRSAAEYAVYASVLDGVMPQSDTSRVVVRSQTVRPLGWVPRFTAPADDNRLRRVLRQCGIFGDLARNFVAVNRKSDSLFDPLPTHPATPLDTLPMLTHEEIDSLIRTAPSSLGFARYRRAYPGIRVLVGFSHVGFSDDGSEAVVYVESNCGPMCGGGALVRLRRQKARWLIVKYEPTWET